MIADLVIGIVVTLLFFLGVYALAASSYADWVREFYSKRDRLHTLMDSDKHKR